MENPYENDPQTVTQSTNIDEDLWMKEAENVSDIEESDGGADAHGADTINFISSETHCDPCKYDGNVETATGFCVSCTEYLCRNCQRDHKKFKLTRSHKVLIGENIPKDSTAFIVIKDHMKCSTHPGNELSFECVAHKAMICAVCLAHNHRHCEDIDDLDAYDKHCLTEVADPQHITSLIDKLRIYKQKKVAALDKSEKQHEHIRQQCDDWVEKWKKHIDNLGMILMNEAEMCCQQEIKSAMDCLNKCTDMENYLDSHREIVAILTLHGSNKEVAIVSKSLTERIGMCKELLNNADNLRPKKLVLQKVTPTLVKSIGQVSFTENVADAPKTTQTESSIPHDKNACIQQPSSNILKENLLSVSSHILDEEMEVAKETAAEETTHKAFSVKVDKDIIRLISTKTINDQKQCSVCAITRLSDGRIVVADENNHKLKLITNLIVVSEIKIPSVPADICAIGNTVFVCFPDMKRIYWYPVDQASFDIPGSYATRQSPISLSVFDENRLIILFTKESLHTSPLIEVREGNAIKATFTHSDAEEFNGIKEATEVVQYGDSCLVMTENDQISCYRVDKNLVCQERLWIYKKPKSPKLTTPHGLVCNTSGNIFVCGTNSNNVHCALWRRKIVSQINNPLCVLVDNSEVVVGCRNDDFLHVYTII